MKGLSSELGEILTARGRRRDVKTLLRFLALLFSVILFFSIAFHLLMLREGQEYSWLTGFYWTLTVMSTLGFGDITFHSDLGRAFTVVVLLSGIVLLLILLPFVFIRFFYAPWLEEQLQRRAPRTVPDSVSDHVILCAYDEIAIGLIQRLDARRIPYVVIEPDAARAAELRDDNVVTMTGALDERETYEGAGFARARLLVANVDDVLNTNITITAREVAETPIVATSLDPDAVDVLELAGANHVMPLRQRLGEQLASRVSSGTAQVHIVGRYRGLAVGEFPVRNTALSGKTPLEAQIRRRTGVTIAALAHRGQLERVLPDTRLRDDCIGVAVATEEGLAPLNDLLSVQVAADPVLVIGGGNVGTSAARALKQRGIPVHVIEENPALEKHLAKVADRVFIGDAADLTSVVDAGVRTAPSVILTTNSDAINIFLTVYCRKLNPDTIIVSRVAHARNIEAVHRAGADFTVTDFMLGVHSVLSVLDDSELMLLGEGLDFFSLPVPASLLGRSLTESAIGARTGLHVVGIERESELIASPTPDHRLSPGEKLLAIGTSAQRDTFTETFG